MYINHSNNFYIFSIYFCSMLELKKYVLDYFPRPISQIILFHISVFFFLSEIHFELKLLSKFCIFCKKFCVKFYIKYLKNLCNNKRHFVLIYAFDVFHYFYRKSFSGIFTFIFCVRFPTIFR